LRIEEDGLWNHDEIHGAVNLAGPNPVRQRTFVRFPRWQGWQPHQG
jgi:NAD dependent epimerase/dehydratase family enzyme